MGELALRGFELCPRVCELCLWRVHKVGSWKHTWDLM